MPVKLKPVVEQKIPLRLPTDEDPDQEAYVVVRQATQKEVERRAQLGSETSRIYREGQKEVEIKGKYVYAEQQRLEAFLTLCECNIEIPDPKNPDESKPIFRFQRQPDGKMAVAMREDEFNTAWGILPENWAEAIHNAVLEVNPMWNPNFQR